MANHPNRRLRGMLTQFTVHDRHELLHLQVVGHQPGNAGPSTHLVFWYSGRSGRIETPSYLMPKPLEATSPAAIRRWLSRPRYGFESLAHWAESHLRIRGLLPASEPQAGKDFVE